MTKVLEQMRYAIGLRALLAIVGVFSAQRSERVANTTFDIAERILLFG